jgi:4-hydroxyphenylpyruvate dioxygenase
MAVDESGLEPTNPLGIDGIEFIEFATSQPQALGAVLQTMGFAPVARHRSREVMLYRQGSMNLIVNAHPDALPGLAVPGSRPTISAIALRVRDAAFAWKHALDLGAWEMPTRASAMELNIPGIRGVDDSLIYFVDRYRDFSIYDVDFLPLPGMDPHPPALAGMHWFGVVQTILSDRTDEWVDFYSKLLGFSVLPGGQYFGILPKGTLLESPCHKFYLQLIEPPPGGEDAHWDERLLRVGLGAPDVLAAIKALRARGVVFVDRDPVQPSEKGALTQVYLGGLTFELVVSHLRPEG